jgi:hypothetical protein
MKLPSVDSTSRRSEWRPETVEPNTTSCSLISSAIQSAIAPRKKLARVKPSEREIARNASVSSGESIRSPSTCAFAPPPDEDDATIDGPRNPRRAARQ